MDKGLHSGNFSAAGFGFESFVQIWYVFADRGLVQTAICISPQLFKVSGICFNSFTVQCFPEFAVSNKVFGIY